MSLDAFIKRTLFWTDDILHGRKVRKHYIQIKKIMNDHDYGKKIQRKNLDDLLDHATTNSEFYRSYRGKKLSEYPVVNKYILSENYDAIPVLASGKRKSVICEWKKD